MRTTILRCRKILKRKCIVGSCSTLPRQFQLDLYGFVQIQSKAFCACTRSQHSHTNMYSHWSMSQCNVTRVRLFGNIDMLNILYIFLLFCSPPPSISLSLPLVMPFQTHFHPILFPHFFFFVRRFFSYGFFCHLIQSRSHLYLRSSRFILLLFLFRGCVRLD